jgi:hypothetical protein
MRFELLAKEARQDYLLTPGLRLPGGRACRKGRGEGCGRRRPRVL